ncbi:hypothetical protein K492DRAFT_200644 [Lichtheimia hyalospora FSU 10163]|nr:hypothetical protein K492DRAFT_200644 [Lichtheimia hyalospora FSU 10163]
MALPFGDVRLMAETGAQQLESDTITVDDLVNSFINAMDIILYVDKTYGADSKIVDGSEDLRHEWMMEISQARAFKKHDAKKNHACQFTTLIVALGGSTRRCMDPVDYVYGVLGMLNIKIPRLTEPKAVWQRFLSELDHYMDMEDIKNKVFQITGGYNVKTTGIKESAYEIDLHEVKRMSNVYDNVLAIAEGYSDEE